MQNEIICYGTEDTDEYLTRCTVYGKTFERENFCGFLANRESFPLESLAVYST